MNIFVVDFSFFLFYDVYIRTVLLDNDARGFWPRDNLFSRHGSNIASKIAALSIGFVTWE